MTLMVNWPGYVAVTAGLAVLLGGTWLLRGARASVRMAGGVGVANLAGWLVTGNIIMVAGGAIILAAVCWCLWGERGSGRRRKGGRS